MLVFYLLVFWYTFQIVLFVVAKAIEWHMNSEIDFYAKKSAPKD